MAYRSIKSYDRVDMAVPSMQTVEKLEERRFLLSLLTVVCVIFCVSQAFADYQDAFSLRMLSNWLVNCCLSLI